jgi:hypothetical protein
MEENWRRTAQCLYSMHPDVLSAGLNDMETIIQEIDILPLKWDFLAFGPTKGGQA